MIYREPIARDVCATDVHAIAVHPIDLEWVDVAPQRIAGVKAGEVDERAVGQAERLHVRSPPGARARDDVGEAVPVRIVRGYAHPASEFASKYGKKLATSLMAA